MEARTIIKKLETEHPEGLSNAELFLTSKDLLPTNPAEKTWGYSSFVSFWIADAFK